MIRILLLTACLLYTALNAHGILAQAPSNTVDFLYDGSGQRIYKGESGGEHTYYISPNLEIIVKPDGSYSYRKNYYFNGKLTAVRDNSTGTEQVNYIHQDHLGSTNIVTSNEGLVMSQQVYYPYGSTRYLITSHQSPITERAYTSQISDQDATGLYYYNARYYNPTIAKFTQPDRSAENLNKYTYVLDNPINFNDPSGNKAIWSEPGEIVSELANPIIPNVKKPIAELSKLSYLAQLEPEERYYDLVPLTNWGKNAQQLYQNYKNTSGWWNNYEAGQMTEKEFFELILSYELGPLANVSIKNEEKFRSNLAEASTHWFYSKCEFETGGLCPGATTNAFYNWLGGASESFQRRWRELYLTDEGYYKKFDVESLNKITPEHGRNPDLAQFVINKIINPTDVSWTQTKGREVMKSPFYWGNEYMFGETPKDYLWKFGSGINAWYLVTLEQKYKYR